MRKGKHKFFLEKEYGQAKSRNALRAHRRKAKVAKGEINQ